MDSPFLYNRYVTGQHFIGRKEDCTILGNLLSQGENVAIWETRGTGKRSLIQQTLTKIRIEGTRFITADLSALDIRSAEVFVKRMGSTLVRTVASTPDEYAAVVARYLGGTHFVFDRKAFSDHDAILSLNWEMDEQDMLAVLRLPYLLAEERPERMFLIVEEFQSLDLAEDGEKLFAALSQVMDEMRAAGRRNFSWIFTGSRVNAMADIFQHRRYFTRRVTRVHLSPVDEKNIVEHIIKGFLSSGKVIDRDLVAGACRLFKCNLFYINHFTSICDSLSKGYIMEPVLLEALQSVVAVHSGRFVAMMSDLTTFQVNLLHAVIDGYTKFSTAEVIRKYGLNSSANVRRLKDALMKKEILTFEGQDERPVLLDPLFEYWLRNTYFKQI
ncbi:MAG: hypothetical protein IJM60_06690 [Bacteroidales bacterium]|jgi:hypothetical protein|nr:hypothetical protein [Bacteroidales bacterium]